MRVFSLINYTYSDIIFYCLFYVIPSRIRARNFIQFYATLIYNFARMSKGILMVAVMGVESDYFKDKDYRLTIKSDDAVYHHFVAKGNQSVSFGRRYQLFPLTANLEIKLYENEETDTRQGYFKIPMTKLYQLPKKIHMINVRCVWMEKADGKISDEVSGTVKLSVIYEDTCKGRLQIHVKQAKLERDTEAIGKMDPYLVCKVGTVQSKTNTLEQAGKNPKWNERFTYDLESIPSLISFEVLDKDMASSDVVGKAQINPQQEGYFTQSIPLDFEIERTVQINFEGKKAGDVLISTNFKMIN